MSIFEAKDVGGNTALDLAARQEDEEMMRLLIEKGADIEAKNN